MPRAMLMSDDDGIELSVVENEEPSRDNQITDNPVEKGVNIADHVKPQPLELSLSGEIIGADAQEKEDKLIKFRDEGTILTYVGRNTYFNMVIASSGIPKSKDIGNGFKFSLKLKQIRIAELEFVDLTNVPIPARPKKSTGKQTAKIANTAKQAELALKYNATKKTESQNDVAWNSGNR